MRKKLITNKAFNKWPSRSNNQNEFDFSISIFSKNLNIRTFSNNKKRYTRSFKATIPNYTSIEISPASPKEIRSWAERPLPNGEIVGEVTSWETVNYKTLKPEPNGLFCQKIFGPIIDYTCACGKKAIKLQFEFRFCPKCGVERTTSQVRRSRMGYIRLKQPVAHTLYVSQKPSPLGLCLKWPNKKLQAILYGTEFCHLSDKFEYFTTTRYIFNSLRQKNKKTQFSKTRPKYIHNFTQKNLHFKLFRLLYKSSELVFTRHLYGVNYDMSWRQVEDFQEFLSYMWEQPSRFETSIPYYQSLKLTENFSKKTIPFHKTYYPIQTGGLVPQKILSHYNLIGIQREIRGDLRKLRVGIPIQQRKLETLKRKLDNLKNYQTKEIKETRQKIRKIQAIITRAKDFQLRSRRRLIYFRNFYKAKIQPAWMILSYLPILPPGLRPITSIRGELIVSDLNSLYRKVLTRNRRLTNSNHFSIFDTALTASWTSWCYNLRQVQEAVDSLLKTGKVDSGKNIKSLLDALKGKRGRFRQNLLGKRVDYSGRSVIVVGPQLKIYECGLPKQMAIELFQPFIIQQLRNKSIAFTTTGAKAMILERKPIIWNILREILQSHPVLLNRAPTLHRLGIQAFIPKLVDGKAILLHPLVCPAFNADFDGDQMAVHVPLSHLAKAEAFSLLLSCNHLLAPASGQPLLLPTQDMILGFYYLTNSKENLDYSRNSFGNENLTQLKGKWFLDIQEIFNKYQQDGITLHTPIWLEWQEMNQNLNSEQYSYEKQIPLEFRFDSFGTQEFIFFDTYIFLSSNSFHSFKQKFIRTTPGRVFFNNLIYE
jgi:DNA-directed RNA polymerase subunit beta'